MKLKLTIVDCTLRDCIFHHRREGDPHTDYCMHEEKEHYMVVPCPLYKMNFKESTEKHDTQGLLNVMRKKRQGSSSD